MPEGRAANQPLAVATFKPPMAALLPGACVSLAVIGSPASVGRLDWLGRQILQHRFLLRRRGGVDARVVGGAELGGQFAVMFAGIFAGARR